MGYENIILEKRDHVATLTINHPPANAINLATLEDIERALDDVEQDRETRVLIITGAGEKGFSAGFDVTDAANADKTGPRGQEVWTRIDRFPKPVIAAINGFALGGGCELALACHFRIMLNAPKVKIGLPELNLGIIPGWGGTQRMTRTVGRSKALDLILFSKRLNAAEALEIGLVDMISEPGKLMDDVNELANRLAERPPIAVERVLRAIDAGLYHGIEKGLEVELEGTKIVSRSEDAAEGFTAFLEKRKPVFKGK